MSIKWADFDSILNSQKYKGKVTNVKRYHSNVSKYY